MIETEKGLADAAIIRNDGHISPESTSVGLSIAMRRLRIVMRRSTRGRSDHPKPATALLPLHPSIHTGASIGPIVFCVNRGCAKYRAPGRSRGRIVGNCVARKDAPRRWAICPWTILRNNGGISRSVDLQYTVLRNWLGAVLRCLRKRRER